MEEQEMYYGIIYRAINLKNGKSYVGQTVDFERRRKGHIRDSKKESKYPFQRALNKYGKDAFSWVILEDNINTEQLLYEREIYWIAFYNTTDPEKGYNLSEGGRNPRLRGEKNPNFGGLQEGVAQKISESLKGKPSPTKGIKREGEKYKIGGRKNKGRKYSDEVNKKKAQHLFGEKNGMFGKKGELSHRYGIKVSEETIKKFKDTVKNNGTQVGEKNGNAKTYKIGLDDGSFIIVRSLKTWCKSNNFSSSLLRYHMKKYNKYKNILSIEEIK